jgi:8-oxo-dGTP pyrophosphatase MutT (NUDIX family)
MPERRHRLREMLVRHLPHDSVEAAHRQRTLELLARGGDPFARDRFDPGHITASAFVLSPRQDRVLLIHHRRLQRWLQPGGHVEPADAGVLAAALREVREETGLETVEPCGAPTSAPFDVDVHRIPARGAQPPHLHFDVRFLLRSPTDRVVARSDAREVRWVTPDEWLDLDHGRALDRMVAKLCGATRDSTTDGEGDP